jgi:hypothetical protein
VAGVLRRWAILSTFDHAAVGLGSAVEAEVVPEVTAKYFGNGSDEFQMSFSQERAAGHNCY